MKMLVCLETILRFRQQVISMNASHQILETKTLSDKRARLSEIRFELQYSDGAAFTPTKEVYDIGDASSVLLYDSERKTVVFTRQFRLPAALSGVPQGLLLEACAGKTEGKPAEDTARREAMEEIGYALGSLEKVATVFSSPAAIQEVIHLFIAPYTPSMKTAEGGGLAGENEHVEDVEMRFDDAMAMMETGEIRHAKTIILLQHLRLKGLM